MWGVLVEVKSADVVCAGGGGKCRCGVCYLVVKA